ncbi:MAG: IS1 family transposase [Pseudobacter sp.]|uniref:IS1 family transposase n=1 Tax=Pseudobacter sp. TaxID=2045420 RepID=UPI003F7EE3FC
MKLCKYCQGKCIRKGYYRGTQKYRCKECSRYHREIYQQKKYGKCTEREVVVLNNEGVGISSMSRILQLPKSSVQMLLARAASRLQRPDRNDIKQIFELDELYTYVGNKCRPCYVIYAINRKTREIVDFVIGSRTKENIEKVIKNLMIRSPKKVFTDGLLLYKSLIPSPLHGKNQFNTNRIERKNLTLRMHLKRLQRKTICYSRSEKMLAACFRLYAWS